MKSVEYTVPEMRKLLKDMSDMYDLARVVDPRECRVLALDENNGIRMQERCYGVWESGQRCTNCSSAAACSTGCNRQKSEYFNDSLFSIQSNPVKLRLDDGTSYDAVVELISISQDDGMASQTNDRRAEDSGGMAAAYHASHDSLTKVLNADSFFELSRELLIKDQLSEWLMISADIKGFRMVNDLFGVEKGNEVLVNTADMLKKFAGKADGLCGRLGGDHFAMLVPEKEFCESELLDIAEALVSAESIGAYSLHIHFGIYRISDTDIPVYVMCNRANAALRSIHNDARECLAYYSDEMMRSERSEHLIVSSFDRMMKEGYFHMYLQPLTDEEGVPFGAEALVRCIQHDGTVIPPGDFIPALENAGLIHELDAHVWELAAKQLSQWKGTDKDGYTISINMSPKDFFSMDVVEVLTGLTEKYGIDSSRLRLEITESALIKEPEMINSIIMELRERGFYIEIDDFGKGYSSLSMLKNIEADLLKIDMEFLRETENKKRSRTILEAIIGMAGSLGMDVITEGVETESQLRSLCGIGCSRFQGFYFSRPLSVSEFESRY